MGDYISAIDNGVINFLNLGPEIWNSTVATVESLRRGTYLKDVGNEFKQIGTDLKNFAVNSWNYSVNTPFQQQLADTWDAIKSPQTLELVTTAVVGSKVPGPWTPGKGNLLKVETSGGNAAKTAIKSRSTSSGASGSIRQLEIKTTRKLQGGNSIPLPANKTTTLIGKADDIKEVIKTGQFRTGANTGGINILNLKSWARYKNIQWLQAAIKRGDVIRAVSDPRLAKNIWKGGIVGGYYQLSGKKF